ncbi:TadE family protein [Rhabdothermincola sp.]|uniref:TadE family protein n=1 Tax=Rhabdothermincola sp. TaxID=2820405 RepID=UPI002FE03EFA
MSEEATAIVGGSRSGRARPSCARWGDRGAALIEFALLLPFLAILVFGTIDLSRASQLRNRLTNAAREGAAFGQYSPQYVNPGCNGGRNIDSAVMREDPGLGLTRTDIHVSRVRTTDGVTSEVAYWNGAADSPSATACDNPVAVSGGTPITFDRSPTNPDRVRVEVTQNLQILTPLVAAIIGTDQVELRGRAEAVIQG